MRIGMQPFTVQQAGDLLFAQLREKRLPGARGVHRQLTADRRRHTHQLGALHLIDNDRLVVALVKHRQIHRFTGIFHQLAQDRVDNGQQITALQKAAADHEGMRPDGPVSQLTDLADEAQLLHGGQQTVCGGVGQTRLLRQLGQRDAAVGLSNPFE
ncbi:hypothetical protein KLVA111898_09805 [Klebsiella variicola]